MVQDTLLLMKELIIRQVVDQFYEAAKTDVMIGYHFRNVENFDEHLPRIYVFWEMQLLGLSRTLSPPLDVIKAHIPLGIKKGEVGRWVVLFEKAVMDQKMSEDFRTLWLQKLHQFKEIFLKHPLLFSSP